MFKVKALKCFKTNISKKKINIQVKIIKKIFYYLKLKRLNSKIMCADVRVAKPNRDPHTDDDYGDDDDGD